MASTSEEPVGILTHLLSVATTVVSVAVFLSPWRMIQRMRVEKTTMSASIAPYVAMTLGCTSWLTYGQIIGNVTLVVVNLAGATLGVYYCIMFHSIATEKDGVKKTFVLGLLAYNATLLYVNFLVDPMFASTHLGFICCGMSIIFYASPLTVVARVLRTRNPDALPAALTGMNILNTFLWICYGYLIGNAFVFIPSIVGLILSSISFALWAMCAISSTRHPLQLISAVADCKEDPSPMMKQSTRFDAALPL